jgi:hypothetical protein
MEKGDKFQVPAALPPGEDAKISRRSKLLKIKSSANVRSRNAEPDARNLDCITESLVGSNCRNDTNYIKHSPSERQPSHGLPQFPIQSMLLHPTCLTYILNV